MGKARRSGKGGEGRKREDRTKEKLTWSNITPVNITAVFILSLANSFVAVDNSGYKGCFETSDGKGDGKSRMADYLSAS